MVRPRFVICVLGPWTSWAPLEAIIPTGWTLDREHAQLEPDARMESAFAASADRVSPSLTEDDERAIAAHAAVAYLVSPPLEAGTSRGVARDALNLISAAFDAGGVAAKCESSGIAHGAAKWRELAADTRDADPLERVWALKDAFVRRPLGDEELLYTCGMHLLGERDIEVTRSEDLPLDLRWMDLLAIYLLAEQPEGGVREGEPFRIEPDGDRRAFQAHPCSRYEDEDFFFNPYGYWRL